MSEEKTPFLVIDCPSCGNERRTLRRYPRAICNPCYNKVTDEYGKSVSFGNQTMLGTGIIGNYEDGTEYNNPIHHKQKCWVGDMTCIAEEAKFGGIVIQRQIGNIETINKEISQHEEKYGPIDQAVKDDIIETSLHELDKRYNPEEQNLAYAMVIVRG